MQSSRRGKAASLRVLAAGLVRVVVVDGIRSELGKHTHGHSAAVVAHKYCEVHAVRGRNQGEGALVQVHQRVIGSWSSSRADGLDVRLHNKRHGRWYKHRLHHRHCAVPHNTCETIIREC